MVKTNIYGDYKICVKCGDPADVIESNKDYCCECWFKKVNGKSFKEVEKKIKVDGSIIRHLTVKYKKLDTESEFFKKNK